MALTIEQQRALAMADAAARAAAEDPKAGFTAALAERENQDAINRRRAGRTTEEADAHAMSLTGRIVSENAALAPMAPAALAADAVINAGYGVKKLLAKTGAVDEPDPKTWYKGDSYFPILSRASKLAQKVPDTLGLDRPETPGERTVSTVGGGALGAAAGVGVGKFLGALGAPSKALTANPVAQTMSGATGGAAADVMERAGGGEVGTGVAGLAGGILPMLLSRTGRMTVHSPQGQKSAAAELVRERTSDRLAALHNLDTAGDRTKIAGYRLLSTDAAKDPGLASIAPQLRTLANEHAGGAETALRAENSSVLSRALESQGGPGGLEGSAERTRSVQRSVDANAIQQMKTNSPGNRIDLSDMEDRLNRGSNIRYGGREDKGRAFAETRDRLQKGAFPIYDNNTTPPSIVGWEMPPENLLDMRSDVSANFRPGSVTSPNTSSVKNAKREVKPFLNEIDDELEGAYGPEYPEYLDKARRGRELADSQEYVEDFAQNVHKGGVFNPDGSRVIDEPGWLGRVNTKGDRALPSGNRSMNLDKLRRFRPTSAQMLEDAAHDINEGSYAATTRTYGPNTNAKGEFGKRIDEVVDAGQSPIGKAVSGTLGAVGLSAGASARMGVPLMYPVQKGAEKLGNRMIGNRLERSRDAVKSILGGAEADPATMADLLRTERAYNPGFAATLALQSRKGATIGAAQGFLAGERAKRYR